MPFTYKLTLGDSMPEGDELEFVSWIVDIWGEYVESGISYAIAKGKHGEGMIKTNGPCTLLTRAELKRGQKIRKDTVLGTAGADGEEIPYNKPYSIFEYSSHV
jgi:hypothetical protein